MRLSKNLRAVLAESTRARIVVRRRSEDRLEEQGRSAVVDVGKQALPPRRTNERFYLYLRRHSSRRGKGRGLTLPACDTALISLHRAAIAQKIERDSSNKFTDGPGRIRWLAAG